jgi:hypothetical protein
MRGLVKPAMTNTHCHSERSEELSEVFSQPVPTCRKNEALPLI